METVSISRAATSRPVPGCGSTILGKGYQKEHSGYANGPGGRNYLWPAVWFLNLRKLFGCLAVRQRGTSNRPASPTKGKNCAKFWVKDNRFMSTSWG